MMDPVVFEHVKVAELPEDWRRKLGIPADARVTVRIEEEAAAANAPPDFNNDPLFGMWRDREDMTNVDDYIRRIRASRFDRDDPQDPS